MKSEEKEKIIQDFKKGVTKLLVATTVIEVGIDNKNANLVQDLIIQIADEYRVALILSTHDNSFAQRMDNIYKISNRNIIEV